MKVTHVSPAAFGSSGLWGGGERYPLELAKAMANLTETRLVTFAPQYSRHVTGNLEVIELPVRKHLPKGALNAISERYPFVLKGADVIHNHQYESVVTNLALLFGKVTNKPVFCTDHGGASRNLSNKLHLDKYLTKFLPVSEFSAQFFPKLQKSMSVIYGGVDTDRYHPGKHERDRKVVFVGRLLPHKGIDVLIEALPPDLPLVVYGRKYDEKYFEVLSRLAQDKSVTFRHDATDEEVLSAYQSARVAVLPSVYETPYGPPASRSELLGLVLLEAMACATPVICTNVGGMPEIVSDGITGRVVEPSNSAALLEALTDIVDSTEWKSMSDAAREDVEKRFTWESVARRCLAEYKAAQ